MRMPEGFRRIGKRRNDDGEDGSHGRVYRVKGTVIVAMSGGVDSSVAAAVLKERGWEVVGVTLLLTDGNGSLSPAGRCCGIGDIDDARAVARRLSIPLYVLDYRDLFRLRVIDYCVESYRRGVTPNPCVACNRWIKFGALLRAAAAVGADFLATGHYVRVERGKGGVMFLKKGVHAPKDQSYFLYFLGQEQLRRLLFPLGVLSKREVRALARRYRLPVQGKPESQDLCFDFRAAWKGEGTGCAVGSMPGPLVDDKGAVLGFHRGISFYTVGQRRGLGLADGARWYVEDIDAEKNLVRVTRDRPVQRRLVVEDLHFVDVAPLAGEGIRVTAKTRYRKAEEPAVLRVMGKGRAVLEFDRPVEKTAPGQAVVFYRGDLVLGGGSASRDAASSQSTLDGS